MQIHFEAPNDVSWYGDALAVCVTSRNYLTG